MKQNLKNGELYYYYLKLNRAFSLVLNLKTMSLKGTLEYVIHVNSFRNIDLFQ